MMEEKMKKGLESYASPEIKEYDIELIQSVLAGSDPLTMGFDTEEKEEEW